MRPEDIRHMRDLAERYAEAAAHPRNQENIRLHRSVNNLQMIRPVVLIDEQPWSELNTSGALTLCCNDPFYQPYEQYLRKKLFQWQHHPADMVLTPFIPVAKKVGGEMGGLTVKEKTLATELANPIVSHSYEDQLADPGDEMKIQMPHVTYEKQATEDARDRLAEAIADLLPVRLTGVSCYISQWDQIAIYRGVTPLLIDLAERPDHAHAIMERMTRMYIERYRQFEALGLLESEPYTIHCTPARCDDLPVPAESEQVQRRHLWGRCMAQIFASVSPAMHETFEIAYQIQTMAPFGLVYYGCCEPLDRKIEIISKIPRLRKVSITPWADVNLAAEVIGSKYVLSAKPNPAHVSGSFNENAVRQEIDAILRACMKNGCSCDIVLKDISTCGHNPENLRRWEQTIMQMVRG